MNILAIGAHFDDIELGCGGTLARHVSEDDSVFAYVATVSGYSNPSQKQVRSNDIALEEGKRAAEILGIDLICGKFSTFYVEFCEDLNLEILKIIENKNIDTIYCHWFGDIHHDHHAVAKATLHSSRHVPRILMYRSNWYQSTVEFRGNYYVDISSFIDKKIEAIKAHRSEYDRVGKKWLQFLLNENQNCGQRIGVEYAEAFEVSKYLR